METQIESEEDFCVICLNLLMWRLTNYQKNIHMWWNISTLYVFLLTFPFTLRLTLVLKLGTVFIHLQGHVTIIVQSFLRVFDPTLWHIIGNDFQSRAHVKYIRGGVET